jgi:hypothetical protein
MLEGLDKEKDSLLQLWRPAVISSEKKNRFT